MSITVDVVKGRRSEGPRRVAGWIRKNSDEYVPPD